MLTTKVKESYDRKRNLEALITRARRAEYKTKYDKREPIVPGGLNDIEKIDLQIWPKADFYVSPDGSGDGKTPFTSISAYEFVKLQLFDGAVVAFERGRVFNNFGDYDVANNNVTWRAYGTGADPILRGSDDITGLTWTDTGGNIYSAPWSNPLYWIYKDGVAAKWAESAFYPITTRDNSTTFRASTLTGVYGTSLVGAKVLLKSHVFAWSLLNTVTTYTDATGQFVINAAGSGTVPALIGYHVKFYGMLQFLTDVDEWHYDDAADLIYYKTAGGAPTGDLRVGRKNDAITINNSVTGFNVIGLQFTQYYNSAINGKLNNGTKIQNCTFTDIKQNALFLWGNATGVEITGNTIARAGQNGMLLGALISPVVSSNTISYCGLDITLPIDQVIGGTLSTWEQTQGCGIVFTYDLTNGAYAVSGGMVQYNYIHHMRYCAINFTGSLTEVSYNKCDETMIDTEDGAAIYCVAIPISPYFAVTANTIIQKNIITNVRGRYDNVPVANVNLNSWGIYVDYQCDDISIIDNTIINSQGGLIKINYGTQGCTITGNVATGGIYGVHFSNWDSLYDPNDGNTFTGNVIGTAYYPVTVLDNDVVTSYNPFANGGSSNNNVYLNPYGDIAGRRLTATATSYTLATWRSTYGGDAGSTNYPITTLRYSGEFAREQEVFYQMNETMSSVSYAIPTGYVDKVGTTAGNNVNIPAYSGIILLKTTSVATVFDSFNGTNGTSISGRTPDTGGTWTLRHGAIVIGSSSVMTATTNGNATNTTSNADVNIMVSSSRGTNASGGIHFIVRHNGLSGTANENYIWVKWQSNVLSVIEHTAPSTDVTLVSFNKANENSTFTCEAQVVGNRIKVRINNEQCIDFTGLTMNPSSLIHGFRQEVFTNNFCATFAISNP